MGNIAPLRKTSALVTLSVDGALSIPDSLRGELEMRAGDRLIIKAVNGALVIENFDAGIRRVQAMARRYALEGVSVADELIAERRAEAERE